MNQIVSRRYLWLWGLLAGAFLLAPAVAEMARVRLNDGTVMRGDVELTESEVLLRNAAGVVRRPREQVEHIEWLEPAKSIQSEAMRRLYALAPEDVEGYLGLAKWAVEQEAFEVARTCCEYVLAIDPDQQGATALLQQVEEASAEAEQPADDGEEPVEGEPERDKYKGVPPPPPLSARDILKLKLSEVQLDGPNERLNVRFLRVRGEPDLEELAGKEMVDAIDYDPEWDRTLERGQPHEKLPIVLKATGLKYADRIEVRGHPRAFSTYRRQVLPLVAKGCVRSGCHGGRTAQAFRFPIGTQSSDNFVYTSFAMLDQMHTAAGPMIDRASPEDSALLRYMLPTEEGQSAHPPVQRGRVAPVLRGRRDARYRTILEWIDSLRSPHPDYQLEYQFPEWFEPLRLGEQPPEAGPEEEPAEDEPEQQEAVDVPGAAEEQDPADGGDEQP